MSFSKTKLATTLAITSLLAACGSSDGGSSLSRSENARVSVALTDAAVDDVDAVNIVITGLTFQPDDGQRTTVELDEPLAVNLLELQNGTVRQLVNDQALTSGDYSWMRLQLADESEFSVVDDGAQFALKVPSGQQNGLKTSGFTLPEGGEVGFTIDFDVRKSLVYRPGPGDYLLKPVLRLVEDEQSGTVTGTVDETLLASACENTTDFAGAVYFFEGADQTPDDLGSDNEPEVVTPVDTEAYTFTAAFLDEGEYTVSYTCDRDTVEDDQEDPVDEDLTFFDTQTVSVTSGDTTTVTFEQTTP